MSLNWSLILRQSIRFKARLNVDVLMSDHLVSFIKSLAIASNQTHLSFGLGKHRRRLWIDLNSICHSVEGLHLTCEVYHGTLHLQESYFDFSRAHTEERAHRLIVRDQACLLFLLLAVRWTRDCHGSALATLRSRVLLFQLQWWCHKVVMEWIELGWINYVICRRSSIRSSDDLRDWALDWLTTDFYYFGCLNLSIELLNSFICSFELISQIWLLSLKLFISRLHFSNLILISFLQFSYSSQMYFLNCISQVLLCSSSQEPELWLA